MTSHPQYDDDPSSKNDIIFVQKLSQVQKYWAHIFQQIWIFWAEVLDIFQDQANAAKSEN